MAKVEGVLAKAGYKTELSTDEEHGLWEIETTTSIRREPGDRLELRQLCRVSKGRRALHGSGRQTGARRSSPAKNGTSEEIPTREELLEKVLAAAKKDLIDSALQRSGRDEPGAALGNNHEPGEADAVAGQNRRRGGNRRDLYGADGRRGRAAPQVHRGQRARCQEPGRVAADRHPACQRLCH